MDGPLPDTIETEPPYESVYVPQVELQPAGAAATWRGLRLGSCAVAVDGREGRGWTVHGAAAADGADARFKAVLIAADTLLVEVEDDRWVSGAASWLKDDHLELWLGEAVSYSDHCLPEDQKPAQWGVRIADGQVFPAYGDPKQPPGVERHEPQGQGGPGLLTRRRPPTAGALTRVYRARDDGKTQERLIATSRLEFGVLGSLGVPRVVDPKMAVCQVRDGRLEFVDTQSYEPGQPVLVDP
jgi:hypothetical protein